MYKWSEEEESIFQMDLNYFLALKKRCEEEGIDLTNFLLCNINVQLNHMLIISKMKDS